MKLKIFATGCRGFRVVKAVAIIPKSKTIGVTRRQKTFTVRTVAPDFAISELQKSFEAAASRWETKIMNQMTQPDTQEKNNE